MSQPSDETELPPTRPIVRAGLATRQSLLPLVLCWLLIDGLLLLVSYGNPIWWLGISPTGSTGMLLMNVSQLAGPLWYCLVFSQLHFVLGWWLLHYDEPPPVLGCFAVLMSLAFLAPCTFFLWLPLLFMSLPAIVLRGTQFRLLRRIDGPTEVHAVRFSIRSLFLLTTVSACVFAVLRCLPYLVGNEENVTLIVLFMLAIFVVPLSTWLGLLRPNLWPNALFMGLCHLVLLSIPPLVIEFEQVILAADVTLFIYMATFILSSLYMRRKGIRLYETRVLQGPVGHSRDLPARLPGLDTRNAQPTLIFPMPEQRSDEET